MVLGGGDCYQIVIGKLPIVTQSGANTASICERRFLQLGHDAHVPTSGALTLDGVGGVNTYEAPQPVPDASRLQSVGVTADAAMDGYTLEVYSGTHPSGTLIYATPLVGESFRANDLGLEINDDKIHARVVGPSGVCSGFGKINVTLALDCDVSGFDEPVVDSDTVITTDGDTVITTDGDNVIPTAA